MQPETEDLFITGLSLTEIRDRLQAQENYQFWSGGIQVWIGEQVADKFNFTVTFASEIRKISRVHNTIQGEVCQVDEQTVQIRLRQTLGGYIGIYTFMIILFSVFGVSLLMLGSPTGCFMVFPCFILLGQIVASLDVQYRLKKDLYKLLKTTPQPAMALLEQG